jgi:Zn-dependent protease
MGGSFKIGRVFGIDVKVHWTFFLLLAFFGYLAFGDSGSFYDALVTVGIVVALFFCVLLHEFGHSLVAIRLGSEVQDITLLPIGGLARMKSLPERPIDEVKVAVAGPLVNVVLAPVFFGLALLFGGDLSVPTDIFSGVGSLGQVFATLLDRGTGVRRPLHHHGVLYQQLPARHRGLLCFPRRERRGPDGAPEGATAWARRL